jgi:hypothetical protein
VTVLLKQERYRKLLVGLQHGHVMYLAVARPKLSNRATFRYLRTLR